MKTPILLLAIIAFVSSQTLAQSTWQAGCAKIKITPEHYMWMAGYGGRTVPADGKLTELWARALVLRDAKGNDAVLITADLCGIGAESSAWVASELKRLHKLERRQFAIATSHTHTGPALSDNLVPLHVLRADETEQNRIAKYTLTLRQKLVDVVSSAYKNLEPANLTWGNGLCTVAVNRRTNVQSDVPQLRLAGQIKGPYDHDVPVLIVRDRDYKLKTIVFGYACHSTTLSVTQWSGDYPGYAQIELEKQHPGAVAMFWAGCGADQNPLPRRTVELAKHYGQRLAQSVDSVIKGTTKPVVGELKTAYREIAGKTQETPTRAELETMLETGNQFQKPFARYLLNRWGADNSLPNSYPYPVQTWKIGDEIQFVILGGEVVVDYALKIKSEGPVTKSNVWVAGYSNDVMAYIPSVRVLKEGGYEGGGSNVYYGFPALWSEEVEGQILGEVKRQLK